MRARALATLGALLATGCGGTPGELPDGADASFDRWRAEQGRICRDLRERVEALPRPDRDLGEGSDAERLRRLSGAVEPIARLYTDAARRTRAVDPPRTRTDVARDYVDAFADRARNYAAIPPVAARGDEVRITELTDRDERLAKVLAVATENARIEC